MPGAEQDNDVPDSLQESKQQQRPSIPMQDLLDHIDETNVGYDLLACSVRHLIQTIL